MFGADCGVIEAGRHRMGQFDLPFFVREQKSLRALQYAEASTLKAGCMFTGTNSFASGFDADHPHMSILQERMEQTDGVAAAADARDEQIGQPFFALKSLTTRFDTDDALKIAHHHRVWMRAENGTQYIMSRAHVCDPIAHRLV